MPTARYPEGISVDPTENMSAEDAKVWRDMNEQYGDLLKTARYPEGVSVDPTENMSAEDAKVWRDMNDQYGDLLKTACLCQSTVPEHKEAASAQLSKWQDLVPESSDPNSPNGKALKKFWDWTRAEKIEAVTLDDALEMTAWDLGYQGRPLTFAPGLKDLAQIRKIDIAREFADGRDEAKGEKTASKPVESASARGGDPYWLSAKYPGVAQDGTIVRKGDRVLYFPRTKTMMVGPKAEKAWREFLAQVADEDFMGRYAAATFDSTSIGAKKKLAESDLPGDEDEKKTRGQKDPEGSELPTEKTAATLTVGRLGQLPYKWPDLFAHRQALDVLGSDRVTVSSPPVVGVHPALVRAQTLGGDYSAKIFYWSAPGGGKTGLLVLDQDVKGVQEARAEYLFNTKNARTARSGLYGFSKAVQTDVDSATKRLTKIAQSIAKAAFAKNERVGEFLSVHGRRASCLSSQVLISALESARPKFSSLKEDMRIRVGMLEGPVKIASLAEEFGEVPFQRILEAADDLRREGTLEFDGITLKTAGGSGLYGFSGSVVRAGLRAGAELRSEAGRIAWDLHQRRSSKHSEITAFLDEHCKTAGCKYSQMLRESYPDLPEAT